MKNYVSKRTLLSTLLVGVLLVNPVLFAPIAGANTGTEVDTPGAKTTAESGDSASSSTTTSSTDQNQNVPDDQLALPISLKQFQELQNLEQQEAQEIAAAIDDLAAKQDARAKKFDAWVNDLLNSSSSSNDNSAPTAAPAN